MSITTSITFTRPDAAVEFFDGSLHTGKPNREFVEEYTAAGKILSSVITFSEDKLSRTVTRTFASEEVMEEFKNDPARTEYLALRNEHNSAYGIVFVVTRA